MDTIDSITYRVARRFLEADARYRPPQWILQMVDAGELPDEALLNWKYVVEKLGSKFNYGGGIAYWRNKCMKQGMDVSEAAKEKAATFGPFKIKHGDDIDEWVKERLKSAGLVSDVMKTAAEWKLEIEHFERELQDASDRIAKHEKGIEEGSKVKQREKWLAGAQRDFDAAQKELKKAAEAIDGLEDVVEKHEKVVAPVPDFERQFQQLLQQATMDLSKREVLAQAKRALENFESEMMNPKMASSKQAFELWDILKRTWDKLLKAVKHAFDVIADWTADLLSDTKQLNKLLESV
jgi:chromosome segregation ATPase